MAFTDSNSQLKTFGSIYEHEMYFRIHKHLELDTFHNLCHVGSTCGRMVDMLERRFSLSSPITRIEPLATGDDDEELEDDDERNKNKDDQKSAEKKIQNRNDSSSAKTCKSGAQMYFSKIPTPDKLFDRVLVIDCNHHFYNKNLLYYNIRHHMTVDGRLLIIERPGKMNSLPLFEKAKERIIELGSPYTEIIRALQQSGFDVEWDIECVPIVMTRSKWLKMVRNKIPNELEIMTNWEIIGGIQEITEGMLKYEGEFVEFTDRLLFVAASPKLDPMPSVGRRGASRYYYNKPIDETFEYVKYEMQITDEIKKKLLLHKADKSAKAAVVREDKKRKQLGLHSHHIFW